MLMEIKLLYSGYCLLEFGNYVHTNEDGDNLIGFCTLKDLALCPTGNYQGGPHFLNLQTGFLIT